MGTMVTATCQCGLETDYILIGGGMFKPTCYFPCLCERCHSVVQVNLLNKQIRCPQCRSTKVIPYDDPRLSNETGGEIVASWGSEDELVLTDKSYKCPQCNQMTLYFGHGEAHILWD